MQAIAVSIAAQLGAAAAADDPTNGGYAPTSRYETRRIEGWQVLVHRELLAKEPELAATVLDLLRIQLVQVERRVPAPAVEKLRAIKIWVELNEPHHPCMVYHPDAGWLERHAMNPEKARCVEISNARRFVDWTLEQPWMVLHELAHGYHHQYLASGYANAEIRRAFDRAMAAKTYDAVLRGNGKTEKAYAATNPQEYFAEASEAFFGVNDFYPFVRAELKRHDPDLFAVLVDAWGRR
jgi:hypothetical protein